MASRPFLDLAYRLQRWLWRRVRPRTRGVKVMLFNADGELMLVRNSYGNTTIWVLPGGGIRPWEQPQAAARREVREELGVHARELTARATYYSVAEGKRDSVHLFAAQCIDAVTTDDFEIAEARFFALDALPDAVSPATARRIAEHRGERPTDNNW
jgi:ADP-ribose pyrophosphatase YjhB (NUDIX family)